ncbi:MAG: pyridoxamine 5'-phosphate oxidase family protein [candidate division FCPU426 bacterium]
MRQMEREIKDPAQVEALLKQGRILHVAWHDEPAPYVLAVNYGYADRRLYFHCAPEGKKLDLLRRDPRVGFEAEILAEIEPSERACGWETRFQSVVGWGQARIVETDEGKRRGLDVLMRQHSGREVWTYGEGPLARMVIVRIDVEHMTGKQSKHFVRRQPDKIIS